jgi:hypothetical protein
MGHLSKPKFRQVMPFGRSLPVMIDCVPNNMAGRSSSAFHTTSWTLVQAAANESGNELAELCRSYWQPVYAFIRRCGHDRDNAQDLSQEFFALRDSQNALEKFRILQRRSFPVLVASFHLDSESASSAHAGAWSALRPTPGDLLTYRTNFHGITLGHFWDTL